MDEGGRPLAGVSAAVAGQPQYREFDLYVIAHGPVSFVAPAPQVTGEDGRFALEFVSPPPFRAMLSLRAEGRVPVQILWTSLAEVAVADVGDVRLVTGCRVSGRVVDGEGRARGGAKLTVHGSAAATSETLPAGAVGAAVQTEGIETITAGVDGGFVLDRSVRACALTFVPEDGTLVTPATVTIAESFAEQHVLLTVVDAPENRCIRGRVLDEAGRGIAAATVRALRQDVMARTGDDGRYTLVRDEAQDREPTIVEATKSGFESGSTTDSIAFGARDGVIVLRAGVKCEVVVREGESGRPVERYGVRIRPLASAGFEGSWAVLRDAGIHPGGRLAIAGLARGAYEVTVEADPARFPPSPLQRFDVADGMGPVVVELFPLLDFAVVLSDDRGAPVVGSVAELIEAPARAPAAKGAAGIFPPLFNLELFGRTSDWASLGTSVEGRMVVPRADLGRIYGDLLYCAAMATSDKDGVARMKAPRGATFVLRVSGAHAPIFLRNVDTSTGRREVRVPRGASIVGRVVPLGVLQDRVTDEGCGLLRTLQVRSPDGGRRFPLVGMAGVDSTGCFRINDAPAGDWVLETVLDGVSPGADRASMLPIATIDGLAIGETREVVVDLARLRPATLRARVVWNGRPAAGRVVKASARIPGVRGGPVTVFGGAARADDDGVAVLTMVPGHVSVALVVEEGGDAMTGRELRAGECELSAGDVVERTFSVRSAALKVRVVGAEGGGVPGVRLVVRRGEEVTMSGATDANGRAEIGALALGEYVIGVVPRAVAERFARGEVVDVRAVEDVRVRSVVVQDEMEEFVVRVPQAAGY